MKRKSRPLALGLCALVISYAPTGVPLAASSAAPPAHWVTVHSRTFSALTPGRILPAAIAARLVRARPHHGASAALQEGCGIQASDAARFLEQGTFGPSFATDPLDPNYPDSVNHVMNDVCFEGWLVEQFVAPVAFPDDPGVPEIGTNYASPADPGTCYDPPGGTGGGVCWTPQNRPGACTNTLPSNCQRDNYFAWQLQNAFFSNALTGSDQLRQRVAWALSQIDVVSETDGGIVPASWMTPYLQMFDRDAFGNYRQLLYDLTVNPAMGEYLNMRGNDRRNVNENYAREILQLFSIGLTELNDDGTPQLDGQGNPIATYDQDIITNFARVFTGWGLDTQLAAGFPNYRDPMVVINSGGTLHDTNPKTLLDGQVVNDDAAPELTQALDNIFNHRRGGHGGVGTFIAKQLIQKLVTSNPTPGYVTNVTNAFNNGSYTGPGGTTFSGGTGPGDMQAVIAAVLLDSEARTVPDITNQTYGHLREPALFITNTLRSLGVVDMNGMYTTDFVLGDQFLPSGANSNVRMDQDVFRPPTVFSYYPPDNQLAGSSLIAPEFAIQSTSTALAHVNIVYDFAYKKMPIDARNRPLGTWIDTTPFEPEAAGDATALIDDLNMRLMHGNMSQALHDVVLLAVQAIPETDPAGRVQEGIYLIASSSQYQVER